MAKYLKNQQTLKWTYRLFRRDYRVTMFLYYFIDVLNLERFLLF